jgi:hypothetical protein
MNKRQKLIYTFAKCQFKAIKKNSNDTKTFKQHYRTVKSIYKQESDEEIKHTLKWTRRQY